MLPPGTVIHAHDGRTVSLSDGHGRWVLVNDWATWCGDCLDEFPALNRIASSSRIAVLGLSDELIRPTAWTALLAAHQLSYPVELVDRAVLPPQIPPSAFLIEMRPISYLNSPDGHVVRRFIGAVDPADLDAAMVRAGH